MKRKSPAGVQPGSAEPIIAPEIMEEAERSLGMERPLPMAKCFVCGSEAPPNPNEQLCWVCKRLKISAWRDVESQVAAQE